MTHAEPQIITAVNLETAQRRRYVVPSVKEARHHAQATFGKQFDPVERQIVSGGIPALWARMEERT